MPQDRIEKILALAALTGRRDLVADIEWIAASKNGDKWLARMERLLTQEALCQGVAPHPFLPGPLASDVAAGELMLGRLPDGSGEARLPVPDLGTHMFIGGATGSGKTYTLGFSAAQVLVLPGGPKVLIIDADGHLRELLSSFIASGALVPCHYRDFRRNLLEPAMGEQPEEALMRIVSDSRRNWYARDGMANLYSQVLHDMYGERGIFTGGRSYPCLRDFQARLRRMKFRVDSRTAGYWESLVNRVDALVLEMGVTYDCQQGYSAEDILNRNLLLDLRGLSPFNLQFFVNDLLSYLMAYKQRRPSAGVTNVVFLDELHRYIPTNLRRDDLAEPLILGMARTMRKWGMGLVLADQVPSAIPSAVLGNMGTRIIMRLVNGPCIRTMGMSCSLTPEQMAYIPELQPGQAVLHYPMFPKPFLIEVPNLEFQTVEGGRAPANPLSLFRWVPRAEPGSESEGSKNAQRERPETKSKEDHVHEHDAAKPLITKDGLDYLVEIAKDQFVPAVARDDKLGLSGYKGNSLRKELEVAGLIALHRFNVGRRGGQIAITEVTEKGWGLLADMKVSVKKAPGRGGFKHRYYMQVVKRYCEREYPGARVEIEEATGNNHWVDVAVYVQDESRQRHVTIGYEILVAGEEKEVGNLKACVDAGYESVSLCCDNVDELERVKEMCEESLAEEDMKKINFTLMSRYFGS